MKKMTYVGLLILLLTTLSLGKLGYAEEASATEEIGFETLETVVTSADLGNQDWLINEVNRQLAPLKVDVDMSFTDLARITSISLNTRGLTGQLPTEISNLTGLTNLSLYSNNLTGNIPASLGQMPHLKSLRLDYNQLTGTIPEGLGNITSIMLQSNQLVGQLPLSLYENRIGENEVNVSGNQVTVNGAFEIPSVYSPYTFVMVGNYPTIIVATNSYFNLGNGDSFTPFLLGSNTFLDLHVEHSFARELFPYHQITFTDTNTGTILYDGEVSEAITIPLNQLAPGMHSIQVTLDGAFNNPNSNALIMLNITPTAAADVTVRYVDTENQPIETDVILTGNIGEEYISEQKEIAGYTFKEVQGEPNGIFSDQAQEVIYVYEKKPVIGEAVTAHYLDTNGLIVHDSVILTGNIGEPYLTEQKTITGYTFKEIQGSPTGVFTDQAQEVTYIYQENDVLPKGSVYVQYVDGAGKSIDSEQVLTGAVGEAFATEKRTIAGYTFKEIQGTAKGIFTEANQVVTYVYSKNTAVSPKDTQKLLPKTNQSAVSSEQATNQEGNKKKFPALGENVQAMSMLGIMLLAGIIFIYKKKTTKLSKKNK